MHAKRVFLFLLSAVSFGFALNAQEADFSLGIVPSVRIPLGGEGAEFLGIGGGGSLTADFGLPPLPGAFVRAELGYDYLPIVTSDGTSIFTVSAGAGFRLPMGERMAASLYGTGGYYYGILTDGSGRGGGNATFSGGMSVSFDMIPGWSMNLRGCYTHAVSLYGGIGLSVGTNLNFGEIGRHLATRRSAPGLDLLNARSPGITGNGLDIEEIRFAQVFPVLFKYYDDHPIGTVVIHNNERFPITEVSYSLFVERYMDNPKQSRTLDVIESNGRVESEIYALFSDSVLDITEGTKVSASIILNYTLRGKPFTRSYVATLELYDRNALTWDDDRKAAAFVTAKDPAVLELARNVSSWVAQRDQAPIDGNFILAMALHYSLREYGLTYQVDPTSSYADISRDALRTDFLQFPRQTLQYSSGDCDDLSLLYAALLESLGIETAFITVPGHIFLAFKLRMEPDEARRTFARIEDLILYEGGVWVPLEVTMVQDGFLDAWEEGAEEWRRNEVRGVAALYPVHDAWELYQPVGLPGQTTISMPPEEPVMGFFVAEMRKHIQREIQPQVTTLENQIDRSNYSPKYVNRLGVLYARYGMNEAASDQFNTILEEYEYVPALLNLGNIHFLADNPAEAKRYYDRAYALEFDSPEVLLAVARVNYELGDSATSGEAYALLKDLSPDLAERFAYLDNAVEDATRAASAEDVTGVVVWDEE